MRLMPHLLRLILKNKSMHIKFYNSDSLELLSDIIMQAVPREGETVLINDYIYEVTKIKYVLTKTSLVGVMVFVKTLIYF